MAEGTDTGVQELLSPQQETPTTDLSPKLIPFDVYHEKDGSFSKDAYLQIANVLKQDTKFEPIHLKQAQSLAKNSKLLPEDAQDVPAEVQNVLNIYAFLRDTGIRVHEINQAKKRAEENKVPYQENEPISKEEASLGNWSLGKSDKVVFAEALLLSLGQSAFLHYIKQYPHIFKSLFPGHFEPQA